MILGAYRIHGRIGYFDGGFSSFSSGDGSTDTGRTYLLPEGEILAHGSSIHVANNIFLSTKPASCSRLTS